ncbi:ROK family protein [Vibrio sp. McD22-P3]|uniref:ROK family protein n=1 Tax=Vibrio sp. McD22-P3 TaxID=2724880 RepID=UPI001F253C89|nr:ROK family protein [Vibrio sp. McD22-P3]MCF4173900.1 ROK family protein [Vibrio sp. McD22-P3]
MLIGLDIGGTKIEGVLVCSRTMAIKQRKRVTTPRTNYREFLASVKSLIDDLMAQSSIESIGVGCCGSINRTTGTMQGANILYLNGQDFLADLKSVYSLPIALTNDANCLAISEFKNGAAKEAANSCLAVILGTGCGGGVVINGDIVDGLHGLGGEIGHNPLPGYDASVDGPTVDCYCESQNCVESFLSGTGLERLWELSHSKISAEKIFDLYKTGDQDAIRHIDEYTDRLARVLGSVVNIIDPEIIVLGGGVSNQSNIYPMVQDKLSRYTFNKKVSTPVVKALHGDSSGVLGAAILPQMKGLI